MVAVSRLGELARGLVIFYDFIYNYYYLKSRSPAYSFLNELCLCRIKFRIRQEYQSNYTILHLCRIQQTIRHMLCISSTLVWNPCVFKRYGKLMCWIIFAVLNVGCIEPRTH